MKNLTKGLLAVSLATLIAGAAGCGGNGSDNWNGTDFTDYGNVVSAANGGFVTETDKYVYFINGVGSSSSDNTFGKPIKGALVAADKSDLSKTQVVIPELIVSSDYDAGVYLFKEGDAVYAYYGTPNREKNSSGAIASSEMTFTKTRLDGKENTKLITVSSHSTSYRMAQGADGAVYIVYYDSDESAIVSYNAKTGKSTTVAKTDEKINDGDGEYLSLGDYKFFANGASAQIVYTMTVYTQKYVEEQEKQQESYSRQTAAYNYMYLYTVGGEAVRIRDGKASEMTYTLKSCVGDYLFYTAKSLIGGTENTYGVKLSDVNTDKEISYPDNITDDLIINSFEEVYFFNSTDKKVVKTTLVDQPLPEKEARETIVKNSDISSLIAVDNDYVYCYNSEGNIIAVERAENGFGKTILVSERKASSSWYAPETVEIDGVTYMLYCDESDEGNSYVFGADLSKLGNPLEKDTDDDDENDVYYIESSFIGVMPAADRAAVVATKINAIESTLDLDKDDDGKYFAESVNTARAAYDKLDEDAQANISSDDLAKLVNAEKAIKLADAYDKLDKVIDYVNLSQAEKDALKVAYDAATELKTSYGDDYTTIAAYLNNNLKYYYQEMYKVVNPSKSD